VVADSGARADWLATACSILSIKKAMRLIKTQPGTAILITEIRDGKIKNWQSAGFRNYIFKKNFNAERTLK
jgi:thiamine biosynthesis lipoprotein